MQNNYMPYEEFIRSVKSKKQTKRNFTIKKCESFDMIYIKLKFLIFFFNFH